jgi:ubiquinone/menaquinone biosynthesis C-methylase UbiE
MPSLTSTSSNRSAAFWDRIARKYATDPIADMGGYEATLQRVKHLLSIEKDVLEIGCGTGTTALRLAPFTRTLLATDVSTEMIAIAKEKLAAQPVSRLSFAVADADMPVCQDGAHDAVLAFNMLHLVGDLDETLKHVAKALKPGGLLISKTPCILEMNLAIRYLALPIMKAIGKAPPLLHLNEKMLKSAITRHGFEIVFVERHGTRGKDPRVFIVARKPK